MALTKTQKLLLKEAKGIAELAKLDIWNIEEQDREARTPLLRLAISQMVVAEVVTQYTLLDEILTDLACRYYFKKKGKRFILWRQKKFRVFVNYIMDEMFLVKKMELVHQIEPLPSKVRSALHRINSIRNAMAHSFFPENRKEHRKAGKVLYLGKDIRTTDGLKAFKDASHEAWVYLARRAYGTWHEEDDERADEAESSNADNSSEDSLQRADSTMPTR
jgi:hypothetical protein